MGNPDPVFLHGEQELGTSRVLAHLASLLSSSNQTEEDHQEKGRVDSLQGVKPDTTGFHCVSPDF